MLVIVAYKVDMALPAPVIPLMRQKCLSDTTEKARAPTADKTVSVDLISLAILKIRGLII